MLANIGSDFRKSGCKGRKEERGRKGMREGDGGGRGREERGRREGEKDGGRRREEGRREEGKKKEGRRREEGEKKEASIIIIEININIFTTQPKPW